MISRVRTLATTLVTCVVAAALVGGTAVDSGATATSAGPNGAASQAAPRAGTTHRIAPSGTGTVRFLGTSDLSAQPDAGPATAARPDVGARRVPHWFTGPTVGAAAKSPPSAARPLVTTPGVVHLNRAGTAGSQSSCGCQPPDTNGAISPNFIVEAVNLSLTVYRRNGTFVSRKSLASFFPTTRSISDPRVQYDNVSKRWVLTFIPIPETTTTTPQLYVAASTSANPNGTWFRYTVGFSGSLYPPGTLLDYPMLGQDANAVLIGTNNFQLTSSGFGYINSAVFAIGKTALYTGAGFSFSAFATVESAHPAVPRGRGLQTYATSYFLAANGSGGYTLYAMTNTGGTPTFTLQGTSANGLWSPPPAATQPAPNGSVQLDTLDGRMQAHPVQADTFIWFAHTVNIGGFPGVRYGAISLASSGTGGLSVSTNNAYASSTSNDWNPSIAVSEPAQNAVNVFLNFATNDPAAGTNVGLRVSGVGPGEGVPLLSGIGTTVFTGGGTSSQTRFGDYSSASIEAKDISPTCKSNTQALMVNQVFANNDWQVRLARVGFC